MNLEKKTKSGDSIYISYFIFILITPTILTSNVINLTVTEGLQLLLILIVLSIFGNARQNLLSSQHLNWLYLYSTTLSLGFYCFWRKSMNNTNNSSLQEKLIMNEIIAILTPFVYVITKLLLQ